MFFIKVKSQLFLPLTLFHNNPSNTFLASSTFLFFGIPQAYSKTRKALFMQVDHYLWRLQESGVLL